MTKINKITKIKKITNMLGDGIIRLNDVLAWIINIEPNTHVHFEGKKFYISGHEWDLSHSYLMAQSDSFIDFLYTVYLQNQ